MSWAKVSSEHKKPLKWWMYKVLCEIGWALRGRDGYGMYYKYLNKLCALGFNLYRKKIWENN